MIIYLYKNSEREIDYMNFLKKALSLLLVFTLIFSISCINIFADDEIIINFPDANLKAALLKVKNLDYNNDGEISTSEAYNTFELDISNSNISNLSGIEKFCNLVDFVAENNNISDLTPLSSITGLTSIRLSGNKISDCSTFSNFTNAEYIYIEYNNITDLTPFLQLKKLKYLSVSNNNLQTGVLNSVDNNVIETAEKIKETALSNSEYGNVWGLYDQKLTYDKSFLPEDVPTYKVLLSVIPNINANPKVENGYAPIKYSMSQQEINTVKAYADLFEKAVEKLSGYRFNVDVDFYVAKNTLTKIYAPAADYGFTSTVFMLPMFPNLSPKLTVTTQQLPFVR